MASVRGSRGKKAPVLDEKVAMLDAYELFKTTDCTAEEAVANTPGCVYQADSLVRKLRRENQAAAAGGEQGRGDLSEPSTSNVGAKRQAGAPSNSIANKAQKRGQLQDHYEKENQPHPGSGVPLKAYRLNHSQRGAQLLQQATTRQKKQTSRRQAAERYVPVLRRLVFSIPWPEPSGSKPDLKTLLTWARKSFPWCTGSAVSNLNKESLLGEWRVAFTKSEVRDALEGLVAAADAAAATAADTAPAGLDEEEELATGERSSDGEAEDADDEAEEAVAGGPAACRCSGPRGCSSSRRRRSRGSGCSPPAGETVQPAGAAHLYGN